MYFHVGLTYQPLIRRDLLVGPEQVAGTGEVAEKVLVVFRQEWEGPVVVRGDRDQPLRSISVALGEAPRALRVWTCLGGWQQLCGVEGAIRRPGKVPWIGTATM